MKATTRAYLEIHLCVILWGFTAILGDLIQMNAYMIVLWRVLITSISLILIWRMSKIIAPIPKKLLLRFAFIGFLVALHWITFYGAIKLANASVALICFATTSFFTAIIEPLILKTKFSEIEIGIGIFIIPGMFFIINGLPDQFLTGVVVGLSSALLATLFSILNKKYVDTAAPVVISMLEISAATLFTIICLPIVIYFSAESFILIPAQLSDWVYLLILALLCTTLPFILSIKVLKHLSAFATNLVINLEPIYGILLAIVILKEHQELSGNFYLGAGIIVISVLIYPLINKRTNAT